MPCVMTSSGAGSSDVIYLPFSINQIRGGGKASVSMNIRTHNVDYAFLRYRQKHNTISKLCVMAFFFFKNLHAPGPCFFYLSLLGFMLKRRKKAKKFTTLKPER